MSKKADLIKFEANKQMVFNYVNDKDDRKTTVGEIIRLFDMTEKTVRRLLVLDDRYFQAGNYYHIIDKEYHGHWLDQYYKPLTKSHVKGDPLLTGHDTNGIGGSWVEQTRSMQ
jgi:hypothetical protein